MGSSLGKIKNIRCIFLIFGYEIVATALFPGFVLKTFDCQSCVVKRIIDFNTQKAEFYCFTIETTL